MEDQLEDREFPSEWRKWFGMTTLRISGNADKETVLMTKAEFRAYNKGEF